LSQRELQAQRFGVIRLDAVAGIVVLSMSRGASRCVRAETSTSAALYGQTVTIGIRPPGFSIIASAARTAADAQNERSSSGPRPTGARHHPRPNAFDLSGSSSASIAARSICRLNRALNPAITSKSDTPPGNEYSFTSPLDDQSPHRNRGRDAPGLTRIVKVTATGICGILGFNRVRAA
jgi:hypothetical protein